MTDTNKEDTKDIELQNVEADGSAPKRRLASPRAARAIFDKLKQADGDDAQRRAILQGMNDGNPPYNQKELDEAGLGHAVNVNFRTMSANLDARAAASHELFVEVDKLVEVKPLQPVTQSNPEVAQWCQVIAEEFSQLITDWDGFLPAMDRVVRESDMTGIGFCLFPDEWDWRPEAFKRGSLLFDPKAKVEVDKNELYLIRGSMTVSDIFEVLEDEEQAIARGWHPQALKEVVLKVFRGGENQTGTDPHQRSTWESIQQMARDNDATYQEKQFESLKIVHFLTKEASGERKVSHQILPESQEPPVFIFENYDKYDRMSEVLWWLPYNYGDGTARSVRGVASMMAPHEDLGNRFLCRVFDAGFLTSSLLLQPGTQMDLSRLQIVNHGMYTILPPDLKANIQTTFQPQLGPLLSLRNVSESIQKNNTGTYRQHTEGYEREASKTAHQVMEETAKEARYEKAAVAHRYNLLDKLYREMFRRASRKEYLEGEADYPGKKEALEFVERCTERGVAKEFLHDWSKKYRVYSTRAIGLGSPGFKFDITQQMLNSAGMLDEAGQQEVKRDWIAARVGNRNTDKYAPRVSRDKMASDAMSLSVLEWNDITEGHQTLVGSDQMHRAHVEVFLPRMDQIRQAAEQAQIQDPVAAYRTLSLAIEHVGQHTQYMLNDPIRAAYAKDVQKYLQSLQSTLTGLESLARRMQAAQEKQQQEQQQMLAQAEDTVKNREMNEKMFELEKKFQLEMLTKEHLNEMREIKTREQLDIARGKAAAGTQLSAEKQAAEIEIASRRADADIAIKRAQNQQ
jgi:hypothetical protein